MKHWTVASLIAFFAFASFAQAQITSPDPHEIPVPEIATSLGTMPGVDQLPVRKEMPDPLVMNDGTRVTTPQQWPARREEIKKILEYYAVGLAPPPPGNLSGEVIKTQSILDGKGQYRLVRLSFGPDKKLTLDIGIFTPAGTGPFPAVIMPGGTPPGGKVLPRLAQGPTQGHNQDVLLVVGPSTQPANARAGGFGGGFGGGGNDPNQIAARSPVLAHGFAYVTFNNSDCGEDTTLRNADGSWAFRNTRFFPAYPGYDWGLLRAWAWGVSRIVDYLQTDPTIDSSKLIVSGVSRTGKSALVAGAFDDRIAMVAPDASSGGGTPAYRFSGAERGGKEGLSEMMRKYPNWFSPHLHQFWGHTDQLPFDEHWMIAMVAPRPFIALEGLQDQNVNQNGVYQSFVAAKPVFTLLGVQDHLGVAWSTRPHAMVKGDWDAMLAFADRFLMDKPTTRPFDRFPKQPINVRDLGAVGDGKTKDTAAFQKALDNAGAAGGGDVIVPAGTYLIGSIALPSNTTLHLDNGADLQGSADLNDYPIVKGRWEGRWVDAHRALISADGAQNIAVEGDGSITGNQTLGGRQMPRRPCVIEPVNCTNVRLTGFTAHQRLMWTIHPTYCDNLTAQNLTIRSIGGNGDGIDVDSCQHVRILNCDIDTGDDCIALKSGRGLEGYKIARPTEDVQISNCTLGDTIFACIGIGSETSGGIRNVRIDHCKFTHANSFAIYIKSNTSRGAFISDITATDLDVHNAKGGFLRVNLTNSGIVGADPVPGNEGIPSASNYSFSNVKVADSGSLVEATLVSPVKPLKNFSLTDITGNCKKGITLANITGASLKGIKVTGYTGPFLATANVTGDGLDGAVPYHAPPPSPRRGGAATQPS